jgi:hypothetical protein
LGALTPLFRREDFFGWPFVEWLPFDLTNASITAFLISALETVVLRGADFNCISGIKNLFKGNLVFRHSLPFFHYDSKCLAQKNDSAICLFL